MTPWRPSSAEWLSEPDRAPDAAPMTHRMRCETCGRRSPTHVVFGVVQDWQVRHTAHFPDHRRFSETLTRPWRTVRGQVR
ncbi:DUF7848 domain-containing protein [Streptomyces xiamenensis]